MGTSKKTPAKKSGKTRKAEPTAKVQTPVAAPQSDEAIENGMPKDNENQAAATEPKPVQAPKAKRGRKPKAKPADETKAEKPKKAAKTEGAKKTDANKVGDTKAKADSSDNMQRKPEQEPKPEPVQARVDAPAEAKQEPADSVEFTVDSQETFKELVEKFAKAAKDSEPEQPKVEEPKAEAINEARTADEPQVEQPKQEPKPEVKVNKIPSPSQKRSFLNRVFTAMGLRHD